MVFPHWEAQACGVADLEQSGASDSSLLEVSRVRQTLLPLFASPRGLIRMVMVFQTLLRSDRTWITRGIQMEMASQIFALFTASTMGFLGFVDPTSITIGMIVCLEWNTQAEDFH